MGCIWGDIITAGPGADWRVMRTFSSPSVISISPIPDSWTRSISFLSFLRSMSGPGPERAQRRLEGELVAYRSKTRDHALGEVGKIGVAAKSLARVDV